MSLKKYHKKRDFDATGEPEGEAAPDGGEGTLFVVQEHAARRHHFDLRLEHDGVLVSFAVPKEIPQEPGEKRLAVRTDDHPLAYAAFEGTIPKGEYGAGEVALWDRGSYELVEWNDEEKIEVVLHGNRLEGKYALVRFRKAGENDWLLLKAKEE